MPGSQECADGLLEADRPGDAALLLDLLDDLHAFLLPIPTRVAAWSSSAGAATAGETGAVAMTGQAACNCVSVLAVHLAASHPSRFLPCADAVAAVAVAHTSEAPISENLEELTRKKNAKPA